MADDTTTQSSSSGGTTATGQGASQSGNTSQGSQAGSTTQTQTTSQQAPARPEYIPEAHWDLAAGKVRDDKALATHFNEIFARDAAEQSRRLTLPQNEADYKIELPKDFAPPQGVEFKIDADNPLWSQARSWAKKHGISQDALSEGIGLIAGDRIATDQRIKTARDGEIAKLGATGTARIDTLTTFYNAHLGEAEAAQIMSRVLTASDVTLHEKLVAKFAGQGSGTFKGTGREAPTPQGRLSPDQIAKLSPAEKLDYSRRFNQSDMPAWKDPRAA